MSERNLVWLPFKAQLDKHHLHYQRFEDKHSPGIPDVNIHIPDPGYGDIWIEMKHAMPNKKGMINLHLRPEQYNWMYSADRAGRACFLLARVLGDWYLWDEPLAWKLARGVASWDRLKGLCTYYSDNPADVTCWLERG